MFLEDGVGAVREDSLLSGPRTSLPTAAGDAQLALTPGPRAHFALCLLTTSPNSLPISVCF